MKQHYILCYRKTKYSTFKCQEYSDYNIVSDYFSRNIKDVAYDSFLLPVGSIWPQFIKRAAIRYEIFKHIPRFIYSPVKN